MIRPLDYCQTGEHVNASLETINARIEELISLRTAYLYKLSSMAHNETAEEAAINPSDKRNEQ